MKMLPRTTFAALSTLFLFTAAGYAGSFVGPVFYGDTITFEVWIAEQLDETRTIVWEASARNEDALEVLKARATLKFPRRKPSRAIP